MRIRAYRHRRYGRLTALAFIVFLTSTAGWAASQRWILWLAPPMNVPNYKTGDGDGVAVHLGLGTLAISHTTPLRWPQRWPEVGVTPLAAGMTTTTVRLWH